MCHYSIVSQDANPVVVDTPKIDAALQLYKQRGVTSSEVSTSDHDTNMAASRDVQRAKIADIAKVESILPTCAQCQFIYDYKIYWKIFCTEFYSLVHLV